MPYVIFPGVSRACGLKPARVIGDISACACSQAASNNKSGSSWEQ